MLNAAERQTNGSYQDLEGGPLRARRTFRPDGSVLLSVSQDKLFRLNGVGTMVWEVLSESRSGLTAQQLTREMGLIFDELNREGRYHFDVSPERLHADIERLLESSAAQGLLRVEDVADGERQFTAADGLCQNAAGAAAGISEEDVNPESIRPKSSTRPSTVETFTAFAALAACDAMLKLAGFARTFRMIQNRKLRPGRCVGVQTIERICGAVDRAQVYYPKKAMCLQRSVVATLLLRRQGVAAEMVVAAKDFPLAAHAWVEVDGRVVNDHQKVTNRYSVMTRL